MSVPLVSDSKICDSREWRERVQNFQLPGSALEMKMLLGPPLKYSQKEGVKERRMGDYTPLKSGQNEQDRCTTRTGSCTSSLFPHIALHPCGYAD